MPGKIKIHAFSEPGIPQITSQHADYFGTFFIDRRGVEIIDFPVAFWPDRVRCRATIFWKLGGAQQRHIIGALDRRIMHIGRKTLVAINR